MLTISREPSAFLTSQVHEEPKLLIAESVNFALNSSKEPNAALIASATAPVARRPHLEQDSASRTCGSRFALRC